MRDAMRGKQYYIASWESPLLKQFGHGESSRHLY